MQTESHRIMKKTVLLILTLVLCGTAYAQRDLIVLYESEQGLGLPAILDSSVTRFRDRNDPNGDGNLDMTLLRDDAMGAPAEIVTFDIVNQQEIWSFPLQTVADALGTSNFGFRGFFDFSTDPGNVWGLFKAPDGGAIVPVDFATGKSSAADVMALPARRMATLDLNGDGADDAAPVLWHIRNQKR